MGFTVSDIQHARYKLTCIPSIMVPSFQHPRLLFLLPIFGFTNPISPHFTPFLIHNHHGYNFHFQSETCASSLFCRNFLSWNLRSLPGPPMGSFPQHLLPPTMGQDALAGTGTSSLPDDQGETEQKRRSFTAAGAQKEPNPIIHATPFLHSCVHEVLTINISSNE